MALNPPDMDSCVPKARCLSGPNEGLAYDPADPCPAPLEFDSLKCDCVTVGVEGDYGLWEVDFTDTVCFYDRKFCGGSTVGDTCSFPNGGYDYNGYGIMLVVTPLSWTTTCCSPPDPVNNEAWRTAYGKSGPNGPWVFIGAGSVNTSCDDFVQGRYTRSTVIDAYKFNGVVVG